ncbi:phage tail protein I [Pseudoalteromonas sp. MMG024]|uniref:phage tail protein I n=1 Tax=Pseudoalteromonas sp. MMG024 TaxID=2909980 RepID=UPI001F00A921|nr:phage tail protein I [Pseudoalteromonas sp. MMG024]MCF6459041.1 phage tail protein I [Pseudoalteromonas sp. MMG024]
MKKHVLPVNASLLERGLYHAFESLVYRHKNPYPDLLNPDTCPVDKLDYLAQERLVPDWDSNASELEKRETIKSAMRISRLAGTRAAIQQALSPLGGTVAIKKWWEHSGAPYHLDLDITVNRPVNAELERRIRARLSLAVSARDTFQLSIGAVVSSSQHISAATRSTYITTITTFYE